MSARTFRSEDDEAAHWLALLRDGDDESKIEARDGLARIFARRGQWSEVADLCELQIAHGRCTPFMYQRLAAAYANAGNNEAAEAARERALGPRRRLRSRADTSDGGPVGGGAPRPSPAIEQLPDASARRGPDLGAWLGSLPKTIIGIVVFVLIFGVGNLALVGGQKAMHWRDQSRLDDIRRRLDTEKVGIDQLEARLRNADASLSALEADLDAQENEIRSTGSRIGALSADIDAVEGRYASGVPSTVYSQYSQMVDEHNALVERRKLLVRRFNESVDRFNTDLARFQADSKVYDDKISAYNSRVSEANGLATSIGSTWIVVPVPRRGGRGHTAPTIVR